IYIHMKKNERPLLNFIYLYHYLLYFNLNSIKGHNDALAEGLQKRAAFITKGGMGSGLRLTLVVN
ncbi:MAG: hypothetical protein KKD12_08950, partial [Proteobacteria bacterium]|nr:hypothetical protein [Pseudomonadota bacterium]MBU4389548.1 hypothetical protein [Pseudomonadota bacterium]